jgi:hypothetical protein
VANARGTASFTGELGVKVMRGSFWRRFNPLLRIKDLYRSIWL